MALLSNMEKSAALLILIVYDKLKNVKIFF